MTVHIGPYGRLLEVPTPASPMPASVVRPASFMTLLDGTVRSQIAPQSSRRWTWTIGWRSHEALATLIGLEQGVFGARPWRWYDPIAAASNLLPSPCCDGTAAGWWSATPAASVVLPDGLTVPALSGDHEGPARAGDLDPVPVLEGRTYTALGYAAGSGGTVSLRFHDVTGTVLREVAADAGVGWMQVSAAAQPGEAGVTWRWVGSVSGSSSVAAPRLVEGPPPIRGFWQPGAGIPRVTIAGMEQVYRLAELQRDGTTRTRQDLTVELIEVG